MNESKKIRVGSRKSELALIQTRHVIGLLKEHNPNLDFEIVTMSTLGDQILDKPLPKIGEKSLFTKELEAALESGSVDFLVHSLKDLPTALPVGMAIGAVLTREDPRDALVLRKDCQKYNLDSLPKGSVIGTSSLRRTAQISRKYPNLKIESIRGNLNTRLKKLDELDKFQGIILAAAGLFRMGWQERVSKIINEDEILYAVGQGALAVECRANDNSTIKLLEPLYDLQTAIRVISERSFLKTLGGGCSAPVAIASHLKNLKDNEFEICLKGGVWSLDGAEEIVEQTKCEIYFRDGTKCAKCPYNNRKFTANIEDLECLRECVDKINNKCSDSPKHKKIKTDSGAEGSNTLNVDLLRNDPHDQCPVQLPIGVDFMGKCPYLESIAQGKSVDNLSTECPFLKQTNESKITNDNLITANKSSGDNKFNDNHITLYCGLVPHKDATTFALEAAENLGKKLAENLIARGALEVMKKAQDIIHGSASVSK